MVNSAWIENSDLVRGRSGKAASNFSGRPGLTPYLEILRGNNSEQLENSVATYVRRLIELNQVAPCSHRFTKDPTLGRLISKSKSRFSRSSFIELPSSSRVGNRLLKIKDWSGPKF